MIPVQYFSTHGISNECLIIKVAMNYLNDSEDNIKLARRRISSGWRDAFCAPTRLITCQNKMVLQQNKDKRHK